MPTSNPPRVPALLLLSVALSTPLQAQLPVKPSAAVPSTPTTNSSPGNEPAVVPRPQHRSHITFTNGLLTVSASNASLNALIREIARQTGMKVTGSVAEDRVFGEYGPADPQTVLATLLDGTGSNILIRSSASDAPLDLILTPRTGAASPPSPAANVADNDDNEDLAPPPPGAPTAISAPRGRPAAPPANLVPPRPQPANPANAISPASETVVFPPADATSTPSTATTTPADTSSPADSSSDSVKTPQQIFEQLQKLRQQSTSGSNSPQ